MATTGKRDGALLYIAQRLGESPGVKPATVLKELKAQGRGYRKQDFLKDFSGITGKPQTVKPGAVKGGILSGVMRRKDVKSLPEDQKQEIKKLASNAIDASADTGDTPYEKIKIYSSNGVLTFNAEGDYGADDDWYDLPDEAEIEDDPMRVVARIQAENRKTAFSVIDAIHRRLT